MMESEICFIFIYRVLTYDKYVVRLIIKQTLNIIDSLLKEIKHTKIKTI